MSVDDLTRELEQDLADFDASLKEAGLRCPHYTLKPIKVDRDRCLPMTTWKCDRCGRQFEVELYKDPHRAINPGNWTGD